MRHCVHILPIVSVFVSRLIVRPAAYHFSKEEVQPLLFVPDHGIVWTVWPVIQNAPSPFSPHSLLFPPLVPMQMLLGYGDSLRQAGLVCEAHVAYLLAGLRPGSDEARARGMRVIGVEGYNVGPYLARYIICNFRAARVEIGYTGGKPQWQKIGMAASPGFRL
jgi:hypothetical protein